MGKTAAPATTLERGIKAEGAVPTVRIGQYLW